MEKAVITTHQINKLRRWKQSVKDLAEAKKIESELRDELQDELCPVIQEGTNNVRFCIGDSKVILKITQMYKREVDARLVTAALSQLPKVIQEKIVRTKHSLVKPVYDQLTTSQRAGFDRCITTKPGKPSMKLVIDKGTNEG